MQKGTAVFILTAVVVIALGGAIGLILHFTIPRQVPEPRKDTVGDCYPEGKADKEKVDKDRCEKRGCNWRKTSDNSPSCTFPEGYGYKILGEPKKTTLGQTFNLKRQDHPSLHGSDLEELKVVIEFQTDYRLRIKICDSPETRYQVPKEALDIKTPLVEPDEDSRLYDVDWVDGPPFGIKVKRRSDNVTIFDTAMPGFIFSDQFIQITTRLNSSNVYGFGEHNHRRFQHDMNWKKWAIFTRDVAPVDEWNLYGAQPLYMNVENSGNAHAVFLLNSNAMDVVLQPDPFPGITYHVIGGILDFYIFLGPSPENVVQQYTEATGRPIMPPYWALGFQLSRWGYNNLTHVQDVVERNRLAGIPQDIQYGDIDYMESKLDFTYDKVTYAGLPEFVDYLHDVGMKYIIILDHVIGNNETLFNKKLAGKYLPYSDGKARDIFIWNAKKSAYLEGECWPGPVYYPDFTMLQNVTEWWTTHCTDFYNGTDWGVKYDALWIDMNEPSNFVQGSTSGCEKNKWNYPPYVPRILGADDGKLFDKTICMDAPQHWGSHYNVHNLYGHSMSITTWETLRAMFPEKRPLLVTRSQFAGSQKYAGHWLGDNQSLWEQIHWSIIGMLEYSLFGFTYTGADICGFWFEAQEEMCQRWMQLGAFYPYSRNHNAATWPDQDPASFSDELVRVSRDILRTRYKLLPFLYTLMHDAHEYGNTVVRPLLHEFTRDTNTLRIDKQFLWGPSFMISPAMAKGQTVVEMYFPRARWYDYYGGKEVVPVSEWKNVSTPLDKINLHVRGGYILPWQEPANTTVFSRRNPMGLIVAMGDAPHYTAKGKLFWDDGDSYETYTNQKYLQVDFTCSQPNLKYELTMEVAFNGYAEASELFFQTIDIWGLPKRPDAGSMTVDGEVYEKIDYDSVTKALQITELQLNITEEHRIEWIITN